MTWKAFLNCGWKERLCAVLTLLVRAWIVALSVTLSLGFCSLASSLPLSVKDELRCWASWVPLTEGGLHSGPWAHLIVSPGLLTKPSARTALSLLPSHGLIDSKWSYFPLKIFCSSLKTKTKKSPSCFLRLGCWSSVKNFFSVSSQREVIQTKRLLDKYSARVRERICVPAIKLTSTVPSFCGLSVGSPFPNRCLVCYYNLGFWDLFPSTYYGAWHTVGS